MKKKYIYIYNISPPFSCGSRLANCYNKFNLFAGIIFWRENMKVTVRTNGKKMKSVTRSQDGSIIRMDRQNDSCDNYRYNPWNTTVSFWWGHVEQLQLVSNNTVTRRPGEVIRYHHRLLVKLWLVLWLSLLHSVISRNQLICCWISSRCYCCYFSFPGLEHSLRPVSVQTNLLSLIV